MDALPDGLLQRLTTWSIALHVDPPAETPWRVLGALEVALHWSDGLRVHLGPWSRAIEGADAPEALELLAAGLFGRARVWAYTHGTEPAGHTLEIDTESGWVEAGGQGPHRRWFRAPQRLLLHNSRAAPADVQWGTPGRLPHAPWVGMLAEDELGPGTLAIDGELDLHPFRPKDVSKVVEAYLDACLQAGIVELRLVHGKGIGNLRRTVHAVLERHRAVASYRLGGMGEGGWGATLVTLRPAVD